MFFFTGRIEKKETVAYLLAMTKPAEITIPFFCFNFSQLSSFVVQLKESESEKKVFFEEKNGLPNKEKQNGINRIFLGPIFLEEKTNPLCPIFSDIFLHELKRCHFLNGHKEFGK